MTSNIGASEVSNLRTTIGFSGGDREKEEVKEEHVKSIMKKRLSEALTPEFLNRIDDIVMFSSLNKENLYKIIDIEINKLSKMVEKMGFKLTLTDAVKDFLIEKGFDEKMGARPLNRAIQRYIEDPLSDEILKKTIKDVVNIDYNEKSGILINNNPIEENNNVRKFRDFRTINELKVN